MLDIARTLTTLWVQRWNALREDEGATAIEYAVIVAIGFVVAGAIAAAVSAAVNSRAKGIK